jgi:hypothetical protein
VVDYVRLNGGSYGSLDFEALEESEEDEDDEVPDELDVDLDEAQADEADDDGDPPPPEPAQQQGAAGESDRTKWTLEGPHSFVKQPFAVPGPEKRIKGSAKETVQNKDEVEIFLLYVPYSHMDLICNRTNKYVKDLQEAKERPPWVTEGKPWPPNWTKSWKELERSEFIVFIHSLACSSSWARTSCRTFERTGGTNSRPRHRSPGS